MTDFNPSVYPYTGDEAKQNNVKRHNQTETDREGDSNVETGCVNVSYLQRGIGPLPGYSYFSIFFAARDALPTQNFIILHPVYETQQSIIFLVRLQTAWTNLTDSTFSI